METVILAIVGAVLSLVFSYFPAARDWLKGFNQKGLVMLGLVVGVAAVYFGLSCTALAPDLGITLSCSKAGGIELLQAVFVCLW
jgi:hypothetical protein